MNHDRSGTHEHLPILREERQHVCPQNRPLSHATWSLRAKHRRRIPDSASLLSRPRQSVHCGLLCRATTPVHTARNRPTRKLLIFEIVADHRSKESHHLVSPPSPVGSTSIQSSRATLLLERPSLVDPRPPNILEYDGNRGRRNPMLLAPLNSWLIPLQS